MPGENRLPHIDDVISSLMLGGQATIEPGNGLRQERCSRGSREVRNVDKSPIHQRSPAGEAVGQESMLVREQTDSEAPAASNALARLAIDPQGHKDQKRGKRYVRERTHRDPEIALIGLRRHYRDTAWVMAPKPPAHILIGNNACRPFKATRNDDRLLIFRYACADLADYFAQGLSFRLSSIPARVR